MSSTSLTSSHVNYLVWRYLQESGYGEAAVKLQRDWTEDPQGLPFGQYIKTHALVTLVQKGLQYHEVEQSLDQHGQPLTSTTEPAQFFGPGSALRARATGGPANGDLGGEMLSGLESSRKHERDLDGAPAASLGSGSGSGFGADLSSQHERKRPRRSNGAEPGDPADPMEVDPTEQPPGPHPHPHPHQHQHQTSAFHPQRPPTQSQAQAPPLPLPPAPAVYPHTNGYAHAHAHAHAHTQIHAPQAHTPANPAPGGAGVRALASPEVPTPTPTPPRPRSSPPPPPPPPPRTAAKGTQVEKIAELSETTYLELEHSRRGSVMHCAWHPLDPSSLLAAGSEALCRIWSLAPPLPSPTTDGPAPAAITTAYVDLQSDDQITWMVSTVAWSPTGSYLAVGLCDGNHVYDGQVAIWSKTGVFVHALPTGQDIILSLRWSPSGLVLLGICAGLDGSNIILWDPQSADQLDSVKLDVTLEDAAWLHDGSFVVAGGSTLQTYRFDAHTTLAHVYPRPDHGDFWLVRHDPTHGSLITCTHGSIVEIWDQHDRLHAFSAHAEQITALELQPMPKTRPVHDDDARLFATSSTDGTVRLWRGKRPWLLMHTLSMGHHNPVMAISFTPDGYAIAAATHSFISVWNSRDGGLPLAAWSGKMLHDAMAIDGERSESEESDTHLLSWDAEGGKLAYGFDRQIAIINFRPSASASS
ncbi:MAG: hypothetical protein M1838_000604 [Thelocarpon superellum]|nr:MAG: hypothetical protein M1838_000604 [Thelocarpon superellum]